MLETTEEDKAARTANVVLGQISKAFHYRDRKTFVGLYKLYVQPHLEFAVPAWNTWTKGDSDNLEKVQERAVNLVSGLKFSVYSERLEELKMVPLSARAQKGGDGHDCDWKE